MKLKLSGNGTLTVTSQSREYCGLVGNTNYSDSNYALCRSLCQFNEKILSLHPYLKHYQYESS